MFGSKRAPNLVGYEMRWTAGLGVQDLLHREGFGRRYIQRVFQVLDITCFRILYAYDFDQPLFDLRSNN
ncbi:MAG: hypothetical protein CM15mP49_24510 [Actinomycetota bacterium]|nr:MAG: hypothetical protein CM15mP49_24510 [Actinomycetota bacterium]